MAAKRRVVKKIQVSRSTTFDDQFWPIAFALSVLGGFLVGTTLAYLRLDDGRWYANAWTWLLTIPTLIAIAMIWLRSVGNRWVRRSMQFALLVCAIVHLMLFIVALETNIFGRVWREMLAATDLTEPHRPVTIPEYRPEQFQTTPDRVPQDFERPVETETPQVEVEVVERQQPEDEPTPTQPQPIELSQPETTVRPSITRAERQPAAPRMADQLSQRSRQTAQSVPRPEHRAQALPQNNDTASQRLDAQSTITNPQANRQTEPRRQAIAEPNLDQNQLPPQVTRRTDSQRSQPTDSSAATLERQVASTPETPRTVVPAPTDPARPQSQAESATPVDRVATRQQETASPRPLQPTTQQPPEVASQTNDQIRRRQSPTAQQPNVAQNPVTVDSTRSRVTNRPEASTTAEVAGTPTNPARSQNTALQPTETTNQRNNPAPAALTASGQAEAPSNPTTNSSPRPSRRASPQNQPTAQLADAGAAQPVARAAQANPSLTPNAETLAAGQATQPSTGTGPAASATVSRQPSNQPTARSTARSLDTPSNSPLSSNSQSIRRDTQPDAVGLTDAGVPASSPRRSPRTADVAVSPVLSENPSQDSGQPSAVDTAEPRTMSFQRGDAGVAGVGQSANLEQALAAADSPATVASGAANRSRATQTSNRGPAMEPSAVADLPRALAGRSAPSSQLTADALNAPLSGSSAPSDLEASATAALTEAASDAEQGELTAATGSTEVDLGPTRRVSEMLTGRASGGGQPEPSAQRPDSRSLARARSGQPQPSTLASNQVDSLTAAPAATGSGSPNASPVDPTQVALDRSQQQGNQGLSGNLPAPLDDGPDAGRAVAESAIAAREDQGSSQQPSIEDAADAATPRRPAAGDLSLNQSAAVELPDSGSPPAASATPTNTAGEFAAVGKQDTDLAAAGSVEPGSDDAPPAANAAAGELAVTRAENAGSVTGPTDVGGGSASPERTSRGPEISATAAADVATLSGSPASPGPTAPQPLTTQGRERVAQDGGQIAPPTAADVGGLAGDVRVTSGTSGVGVDTPAASRASTTQDGPLVVDNQQGGSPGRSQSSQLPSSMGDTATELAGGSPAAGQDATELASQLLGSAELTKRNPGAIPVSIEDPEGVGGLADQVAVDVGIQRRQAQADLENVQVSAARFLRKQSGGRPDFSVSAVIAAEPFRRRTTRDAGNPGPAAGQPSPLTERAIELGLVFLSRYQSPDGHWSLEDFEAADGGVQMRSDTAATALALLAFQGAGYHHHSEKYGSVCSAALNYLLANQTPQGDLYMPMDERSDPFCRLYSHSIAALALCEAYGMTQDPEVGEAAQRALDFIVATQNRELGGWRYIPQESADTSVTGWMMMALKSGQLAGLTVPDESFQAIRRWLDRAQASSELPHLYRYNPYAPDTDEQRHGRRASKTMSSVGLLMRLYLGWKRDNPNMHQGAQYLAANLPTYGSSTNPQRDTYYWYYATQVMFHMGGEHWTTWQNQLYPMLRDTQLEQGPLAGSWDPKRPIEDRWGPHAGRLYVTTMNLLSLEVFYRHLPLYDDYRNDSP